MINGQRFWDNLMALADITDEAYPYTRRSFSPLFIKGRAWLTQKMEAAGLVVTVDHSGNLIGRLEGDNPNETIMVGSHSDTVTSGGRFDGVAGVIAALECALTFQMLNIKPKKSIEFVDFLAEEPSEWGLSCIGSRGLTGHLNAAMLASSHPQTGEPLHQAIRRVGGAPELIQQSLRKDIKGFLELHIEQGSVLESENISIGIVTGIVGITRLSLTIKGKASHAGTTPMSLRSDALVAASNIILEVRKRADILAASNQGYFVATCGDITNYPNASNVVSGEVTLIFDIRSDRKPIMEQFVQSLKLLAEEVTAQWNADLTAFSQLSDSFPMECDAQLMECIRTACCQQNLSYRFMPSGAGHDAAFLATIVPSAMIFVPSVAGKSHCPDEWTEQQDLVYGVAVLMNTLLALDAAV